MTSRANSPAPADTLAQIFAQFNQLGVAMNTLTTSVSNLTRENEKRTFKISEIAKNIGLPGTIKTDNQMTEDRSEDDVELREVERRRQRNEDQNENPKS